MNETFAIHLTADERNALLQLLDVAVKAAGLYAAEAALVLARKAQNAVPSEEPVAAGHD